MIRDFGTIKVTDRNLDDLKKDIEHFDPNNSVVFLVYFTKEGEDLKYYFRTYTMNKEALWNGIGEGQEMPALVAWDEPPDGEYHRNPPPPVLRPTKLGTVNIKTLNYRNGPGLSNRIINTYGLGAVLEFYSDQVIQDAAKADIQWVEVKAVNGKAVSSRWVALKYLKIT